MIKWGTTWGWTDTEEAACWIDVVETAFQDSNRAIAQVQALGATDPNLPCSLTVSVEGDGFDWGLWQKQEKQSHSAGF